MWDYIKGNLPESLFLDIYDLADRTDYSIEEWEAFLDEPDVRIYMESKRNRYLYSQGYKALNRLITDRHLQGPDVSAIKATIEQSGILNKDERRQNIVITRIPDKLKEKPKPYKEDYRELKEPIASFDPPEPLS